MADEQQEPTASQDEGAGTSADWSEQAQALTMAWTEAQSTIWNEWATAVRPATDLPGEAMADWMEQWHALAWRSLTGPASEADGTSRELIERVLSGEQAFLGFVDMTLGMMRAVAPKIAVGDEWMELLRRFLDRMKDDMVHSQSAWTRPEALAAATGDTSELWRLYSIELQGLLAPWATAYSEAAQNLSEAGKGDPDALRKTHAGFIDAYEVTFGHSLSAPSVGLTRESSERLLKSFDAWVEMNRAALEFQTEIASEGAHAVEALMRKLVDMGERGERVKTLRQIFDLWADTVDGVYYELFSSEDFATLQGRFVNASMEYRKRRSDLVDEAMASAGLPGRKEIDQIHRHIHDLRVDLRFLRREVRTLRRELASEEVASAEVAPTKSEKKSKRKSKRKGKGKKRGKGKAARPGGKRKAGTDKETSTSQEGGAHVPHPDQAG